ncbi:MAG: helix-hairpin-helix domain-containing protein, partial [Pseudomonadota bacterium]
QGKPVPAEILVNVIPADLDILEEGLSLSANRKVSVTLPQRGPKKEFLDFVTRNADEALQRHILERQADSLFLEEVAQLFDMDKTPDRIEIYDNSHISGTNMIGAMVVAGPEGLMKKAYRKFNIKSAQSADDYGMMREVMTRRFANVELGVGENWPNLLLIDGGLGQLNAVHEVLDEMGVSNYLTIVGIAKGEDRNAGREKFFMRGKEMFQLPLGNPVLHYLQRLRDEAHRFAIGTHRSKRAMATGKSLLDDVPNIGPKRKKALLHHFGSVKAIQDAIADDLAKVDGISRDLAKKIYEYFHSG